jgi:hypothetical protein
VIEQLEALGRPFQDLRAFEHQVLERIVMAGLVAGLVAGVLVGLAIVLTRTRNVEP